MTLLSNVIKSNGYVSLEDMKRIAVLQLQQRAPEKANSMTLEELEQAALDAEIRQMRERILSDAEQYAEEQVRSAAEEADRLREAAKADIEQWWNERRQQDTEYLDAIRMEAYELAYQEGLTQAEQAVQAEYETMLHQAAELLQGAQQQKEQIIQEAEPFLLELSCSIAQKIVQHELTSTPEWMLDLIRKALTRRKERGVITLCVSPAHFTFVLDARDELALMLDSQAELQILPDSSVTDHGCVVRSSFGSIDARVDTQLTEIKSALLQLAARNEGE
ncbi:FliH/SctL family protein [Paenibacillus turpanensis]|uniref:FliH/SctL family protein n=1 Tax=Paenibacillus turpanensis TaxID=2689078 RepID=UPI003132BCC6